MNKGRIALMLPRFSRYGGVEGVGYSLAETLAQRGYEVDFICARQETEAPEGVRVLAAGRPFGTRFMKLAWFLLSAERQRRKGNYDLSVSLGKNWNQDIIRMGGGPLRIFWQKSEKAIPKGWKRWKKRIVRWLSPSNWLIFVVEKRQFKENTRVVAVSHLVRQWLLEAYPALKPENVAIVYNKPAFTRFFAPSVEERRAAREALLPGSSSENLLFIGTATTNFELKGVGPLIRCLVSLPENMHLFIAGGRASASYKVLAGSLGVGKRVHFCGRLDDMPRFYQALDVFVLDTFYDACSNALLEALACGCASLTTKDNGAAFFLGEASIIQDPASPEELTQKILYAASTKTKKAFVWPESVASGIAAYAEFIEARLRERSLANR